MAMFSEILAKAIAGIGTAVMATASLILYFFFGDAFLPRISDVEEDNRTNEPTNVALPLNEDAVAGLRALGFKADKAKEIVGSITAEYGPLSASEIIKKGLSRK